MRERKFVPSLRRYIYFIIGFLCIMLVVYSAIIYTNLNVSGQAFVSTLSNMIFSKYLKPISQAVEKNDFPTLQTLMKDFAAMYPPEALEVGVSASGVFLASSDARHVGKKLKDIKGWKVSRKIREDVDLVIIFKEKEIRERFRFLVFSPIFISLLILLATILFGLRFEKSAKKKVSELISMMDELSEGNFTVVKKIAGNDEIAQISAAVYQMKTELEQLVAGIKQSFEKFESVLNEARSVSAKFSELENILADSGEKVSLATEALINSAESFSKEIELLSEKLLERKSEAEIIRQTVEKSKAITTEMEGLLGKMGEIVETISSFMEQTNLLSVNASIEAARSVQASAGFGVIASEIHRMSEKVQSSFNEILIFFKRLRDNVSEEINLVKNIVSFMESEIHFLQSTSGKIVELDSSLKTEMSYSMKAGEEAIKRLKNAFESVKEVLSKLEENLLMTIGTADQMRFLLDKFKVALK